MLTSKKLPLHVINRLKFDLGLPFNYITKLLSLLSNELKAKINHWFQLLFSI